jgi:hypothetical protein
LGNSYGRNGFKTHHTDNLRPLAVIKYDQMQTFKVAIIILTLTTFFSCDNSTSTKKIEGYTQNDSIPITDTAKKESVYIDTSDVATEKVETVNKVNNEVLEDTITDINFTDSNVFCGIA